MGKKTTIIEIQKFLEDISYTLLSTEYNHSHEKLKFKCNNGHIFEMKWYALKQGQRCPRCAFNKRINLEEKIQYFEKFNYTFIKECADYKYHLICPNKHDYFTTFINFKGSKNRKGHRCPKCINKEKYTIDEIKEYASLFNYEIFCNEYKNNKQKLLFKCPVGHQFYMSFQEFKNQNSRCKICNGTNKNEKLTLTKVKEYVKQFDYEILDDIYINSGTKMTFKCPKGHISQMKFNTFKNGHRCRKCFEEKILGENHYNWNPNLTNEERINKRKFKEYDYWRINVFKRDSFTCQCCNNKKSGILIAHHLLNYSEHENLRLNINNGITLCKKCHIIFHNIYGYKNNTPEQFWEFVDRIKQNKIKIA